MNEKNISQNLIVPSSFYLYKESLSVPLTTGRKKSVISSNIISVTPDVSLPATACLRVYPLPTTAKTSAWWIN